MRRGSEFGFLVAITLLLLCFGLTMAYSASASVGQEMKGDDYYYFKRMVAFALCGAIAMFLAAVIRHEVWTRYWPVYYAVSVVALLLVFTPLGVGAGVRRYLNLGFITVQPSEFARLAAVFFLASFCARRAEHLSDLKRGFIPPMAAVSVLAGLILAGRDLGIPATIGLTTLLILYIAGANVRHLAATGGLAILCVIPLIIMEPYRIQRLIAFIDPWKDPKGDGWQIIQSMAALGSGGAWGVGLGRGIQKCLYLPAAHTDFVFSIIGEETGLVGTMAINLAFALLAVVGTRVALRAANREASFLALGLSFMICITALINMAVAVDLLPTKGITLPLVSYGGSSLLTNMIAVGILMNIARVSVEPEQLSSITPMGSN
ncbi:MAG: stage V sporulation protein E [Candidatus Abyssubacteria bacterium]